MITYNIIGQPTDNDSEIVYELMEDNDKIAENERKAVMVLTRVFPLCNPSCNDKYLIEIHEKGKFKTVINGYISLSKELKGVKRFNYFNSSEYREYMRKATIEIDDKKVIIIFNKLFTN